MSHTIRKPDQTKEYFDSQEQLQAKVKTLAQLIRKSRHFIVFTGAGISTSCGIPDFRSGVNTKLQTGPGVWQKNAHGLKTSPGSKIIPLAKAIPSFTHMTLVKLQQQGLLKFLVSQNIDGLHLRSGFNTKRLAQLHGNRCLQKCKGCKSQFLRDFRTRQAKKVHQHQTSRKCQKCDKVLYDSIINFGQDMPQYQLDVSYNNAEEADLCLAMGSSLTVTPAADIPKIVGKKGKLVIINLQKTPLDDYAFLRIGGFCDDVMRKLVENLQLKVQNFKLTRLIRFEMKKQKVVFRGIDDRGIPFSFLKQIQIEQGKKVLKKQPFSMQLAKQSTVKFKFYGYLGQPDLKLDLKSKPSGVLKLVYDPESRQWIQKEWMKQKAPQIAQLD